MQSLRIDVIRFLSTLGFTSRPSYPMCATKDLYRSQPITPVTPPSRPLKPTVSPHGFGSGSLIPIDNHFVENGGYDAQSSGKEPSICHGSQRESSPDNLPLASSKSLLPSALPRSRSSCMTSSWLQPKNESWGSQTTLCGPGEGVALSSGGQSGTLPLISAKLSPISDQDYQVLDSPRMCTSILGCLPLEEGRKLVPDGPDCSPPLIFARSSTSSKQDEQGLHLLSRPKTTPSSLCLLPQPQSFVGYYCRIPNTNQTRSRDQRRPESAPRNGETQRQRLIRNDWQHHNDTSLSQSTIQAFNPLAQGTMPIHSPAAPFPTLNAATHVPGIASGLHPQHQNSRSRHRRNRTRAHDVHWYGDGTPTIPYRPPFPSTRYQGHEQGIAQSISPYYAHALYTLLMPLPGSAQQLPAVSSGRPVDANQSSHPHQPAQTETFNNFQVANSDNWDIPTPINTPSLFSGLSTPSPAEADAEEKAQAEIREKRERRREQNGSKRVIRAEEHEQTQGGTWSVDEDDDYIPEILALERANEREKKISKK